MRSTLLVLSLIALVGCGGTSNVVDVDGSVDVDGDVQVDGNVNPDSSMPDVVVIPVCGDGLVEGGEDCDDGELVNNDGCSATCEIETGWDCDEASPSLCAPVCGDTLVRGNETCDDGNAVTEACVYGQQSCTVCNSACVSVAGTVSGWCGDGVKNGTEECDDAGSPNDFCSDTCERPFPVNARWVCVFNGYMTEENMNQLPTVPPTCESNGYLPYEGYQVHTSYFQGNVQTKLSYSTYSQANGYFTGVANPGPFALTTYTRVCYSSAVAMPTNTVSGGGCVSVVVP